MEYCDFIVCKFSLEDGLHVERITKENTFWNECVQKAELLFQNAFCLNCLEIGTQDQSISSNETDVPTSSAENKCVTGTSGSYYCYCRGPDEGEMIGVITPNASFSGFTLNALR